MKILVISDTHGSLSAFEKVESFFKEVDMIFHLGDVLYHGPRNPIPEGYNPKILAERLRKYDISYVRGNCDADVDLMVLGLKEMPRIRKLDLEGFTISMTHGDAVEDPLEFARSQSSNVVLLGHTHIPRIDVREGVLILNPGSPSLPKGDYPGSFAIVEVELGNLEAEIFDLNGKIILKGGSRL